MADIFDRLAGGQATPSGDIFDRFASATAPTGGDIFDRFALEAEEQVPPPAITTPEIDRFRAVRGTRAPLRAEEISFRGKPETEIVGRFGQAAEILGRAPIETQAGLIETGVGVATDMAQFAALAPVGLKSIFDVAVRGKPAEEVTQETIIPAQEVMNELIGYEPRTEKGRQGLGTVHKFFELFAEAGEFWGERTPGGPVAQAAVDTFIQVAPLALGPLVKAKGKGREAEKPLTEQEIAKVDDVVADMGKKLEEKVDFKALEEDLLREPPRDTFDKLAEERVPEAKAPEPVQQRLIDIQPKFPEETIKKPFKEGFKMEEEIRAREVERRQPGLFEPKKAPLRKKGIDPEKDSLTTFIRKDGRVNVEGVGGADIKALGRLDLTNNKTGKFLDDSRVAANEMGYGPFDTISDYIEAIRTDISGKTAGEPGQQVWSKAKQWTEKELGYPPEWDAPLKPEEKALSSATWEVAKKVDDFVEPLPMGLSVKDISKFPTVEDVLTLPKGAKIESISKAVEKRWGAAKGIGKQSFVGRAKNSLTRLKQSFQRSFIELDTAKFPVETDILRRYRAVPETSKVNATQILKGITAGLGKNKYDIFTRNVVLPDIAKSIEAGLYEGKDLPFGYKNKGEVLQDVTRFREVAEANPSILRSIDRRNKFLRVLKQDLVKEKLLPDEVLADDIYFHRQILEHARLKKGAGVTAGQVRERKKGFQLARKGSEKDFNTEYVESEFEYIAQAISQLETKKTLRAMERQADIAKQVRADAKEQGLENWKDAIPEGYTTWQPKPGTNLYTAKTIPERLMDKFEEGTLKESELQEVMALGSKKKEWVIPEELAKTLDEFKDFDSEWVGNLSKNIMTTWKQWTLINPLRVLKYNLNNLSGDFDIAMAYNPKILKHARSSASELYGFTRGKGITKEIGEAVNKAVIDSGMTVHDIPDISKAGFFKTIMGEDVGAIQKIWKTSKEYTTFRENILRLAAYKHFKGELAKGKRPYGASNRGEVDALYKAVEEGKLEKNDVSAKLARELIGDYGNLSTAGQWLRTHMIPFYSWIEINTPRYMRLFRNAPYEGIGRGRAAKRATWATAKKTTGLAVRAQALYGLVNLWNKTFFADEEKRLGDAQRRQLHLILGKREDGSIISVKFQGAFSDMMAMVGLEDYPTDIAEVASGKAPISEKAKEAAIAFPQRLIQSARPIAKAGTEALVGYGLYPDITAPRPIRDPFEHLARTFSVSPVYKYLAGKPTRGIKEDIKSLLLFSTDPGEASYYTTKEMLFDFLKEKGVETPSMKPTKRSNALYYYKQSLRFGDEKKAEKFLNKYKELGGTRRGFKTSITKTHPLAMLPKKYRAEFSEGITPEEKEVIERSIEWYNAVYLRR